MEFFGIKKNQKQKTEKAHRKKEKHNYRLLFSAYLAKIINELKRKKKVL